MMKINVCMSGLLEISRSILNDLLKRFRNEFSFNVFKCVFEVRNGIYMMFAPRSANNVKSRRIIIDKILNF